MAIYRLCSVPDCNKPAKARGWCGAHWWRWRHHGDPLSGGTSNGQPLKYLRETVLEYTGDSCIKWPFSTDRTGYGFICFEGRNRRAHNLVCEMIHGAPIGDKIEACHSCGNGHLGCVAPRHLYWGSRLDNAADMVKHGRSRRGEKCNMAKLTEKDVREIRSLQGQLLQREIAEKFGISHSQVSRIHSGTDWGGLR